MRPRLTNRIGYVVETEWGQIHLDPPTTEVIDMMASIDRARESFIAMMGVPAHLLGLSGGGTYAVERR